MHVLVTGSNGLIGSEAVAFYDNLGADVVGVDNNMRATFFGQDGDTRWNQSRLEREFKRFRHQELDIRHRAAVLDFLAAKRFHLIIHCAAQPSHDLAARMPFEDFDVNAVGTFNLLEAFRRHQEQGVFIFMSTNKVYGDAPNELPLVELATRWEFKNPADYHGISENCRIDQTMHSIFGASKTAADVMAQEYGDISASRSAFSEVVASPALSTAVWNCTVSYLTLSRRHLPAKPIASSAIEVSRCATTFTAMTC